MPVGLGVGAGVLGSQAGLDSGRQRPSGLVGVIPVSGQLGGGHGRRAGAGQLGPLGERAWA